MSDRLDVVLVDGNDVRIHHQRWGATALVDMLLAGPDRACELAADGFEQTSQLTDVIAACVIDRTRRALVIAGPAEVISQAGKLKPQDHELLKELAVAWPGFRLSYEPDHTIEPILAYVHGLGLPLDSLNPAHAIADARNVPRFEACTYDLEVPEGGAADRPSSSVNRSKPVSDLEVDLSVRAWNQLEHSGLATVGDVLDHDDAGLARLGISARSRREILAVIAAEE